MIHTQKMHENAYEISLPPTLQISPIFNVANLAPYKGLTGSTSEQGRQTEMDEDYVSNLAQRKPVELEAILDTKLLKQTRHNKCMQHLVKWKGLPNIDATWLLED